jgi:hypothetical protein
MDLMLPETMELFAVPVLGQVKESISPNRPGRVAAIASTWTARFYNPYCEMEISPGDAVNVVGRHGIMLLVVPLGHSLPPLPQSSSTLQEWRSRLTAMVTSRVPKGDQLPLRKLQQVFLRKGANA